MPFTGGLGGFGLELADWLVLRGARKLVLSSRRGGRTGYLSFCVRRWCSYGATVVISLADITTESGVRALLSEANRMGQVDAIFNLAVVSIMLDHICIAHNGCHEIPIETYH
jgi:fatty acid synthase